MDLVWSSLKRTAFSPFFTGLVSLLLKALQPKLSDDLVAYSVAWFLFTFFVWLLRYLSILWRNGFTTRVDWRMQIVLITGGASGIGALLANTLALRSTRVVVLDTKQGHFDGDNITSYICDISDSRQIDTVRSSIIRQVGHPTIIVNNAVIVIGKTILDLSTEEVQRSFAVNTLSHFHILKAFLPHLIQSNTGHVVTMSSVLGEIGVAQLADYSASKAALIALHESLRYELDKKYHASKVRTTLVLPGHVETNLFGHVSFAGNPVIKFFAPSLSTRSVVERIICAIDNQHSTTIRIPIYVNFTPILRLLPSYLRDFFQWLSNADSVMSTYSSNEWKLD